MRASTAHIPTPQRCCAVIQLTAVPPETQDGRVLPIVQMSQAKRINFMGSQGVGDDAGAVFSALVIRPKPMTQGAFCLANGM